MAESEDFHSDEELDKATKDGTIREGTARVHHKLFPKYGFLIPESPMYPGETIFFGLTAHVDAAKRYIADLRDELRPEHRVKFMAVPVQKDGSVKWKALVVGPLPTSLHTSEENEENQQWVVCKILPNIQPNRGFATPEGGNQYSDNVFFTCQEASEGLDKHVTDLRTVFKPWEVIRALVVNAEPKYKAKYKAIKVCKLSGGMGNNRYSSYHKEDNSTSIEEMDRGAVSWIYAVLKSKGSIKISKLVANLSGHPDVRAIVKPQRKSIRKFLSKYPKFFRIKENYALLDPNCPHLHLDSKVERFLRSIDEKNWSDTSESDEISSEDDPRILTPSPVPYSSQNLKAAAGISSNLTVSMLASIIKSLSEARKMIEIYKVCKQRGWEGMISVAMVAQVVTNNPKFFAQDERGCVILTDEGSKLSVKRVEPEAADREDSQQEITSTYTQGNVPNAPLDSARSAFSGISAESQQFSASGYDSNLSTSAYYPNMGRSIFSPISNDALSGPSAFQQYDPSGLRSAARIFPTSSIPSPTLRENETSFENGNVYQSDTEESIEDKQKTPSKPMQNAHFTEEESRFLSVISRGVCPNTSKEEVFKLLQNELESLGITQGDGESDRSTGVLSMHVLCIQMDIGNKPRAKFKHFTPSGRIAQTTATLPVEKVSLNSLMTMLNAAQSNFNITRVGRFLYGIDKTYHCIRILSNDLEEICGCTISFRSQEMSHFRMPNPLEIGGRKKIKIVLTNADGSNNSRDACAALKKYALEKSVKSTVAVVDLEGQIFGFGEPTTNIRRVVCGNLDTQQYHLKEVVHHHPNLVVANAIDTVDSLKLLRRISSKGIAIYAEVEKSLERNVRKIFEVSA